MQSTIATAVIGAVVGAVAVWTALKMTNKKSQKIPPSDDFTCKEATPNPTTVDGWLTLATKKLERENVVRSKKKQRRNLKVARSESVLRRHGGEKNEILFLCFYCTLHMYVHM